LQLSSAPLEAIQSSPLGPSLRLAVSLARTARWRRRGCPPPAPPHLKSRIVRDYAVRNGIETFVETGTYRGDTLAVVSKRVPRSVSVELDPHLAARARRRFARHPEIEIVEGDSAVRLPEIVAKLDRPALFWLDGHYSSGVTALGDKYSPIEEEIHAVLGERRPDHIVLVDDARLFVGDGEYPSLSAVRESVASLRPGWSFAVVDDIIRIHHPDVR
jgi:hypothetical protein